MSPILTRKLRISVVAACIGTTPKVIRNWLQRDQIILYSEDVEGWRSFSHADLAMLMLTRLLVDYGFSVTKAAMLAGLVVDQKAKPLFNFENTPPSALVAAFQGFTLRVWKDHEEWKHELDRPGLPFTRPSFAYLTIDLHDAIKTAFDRVSDWFDEADGEDPESTSAPGHDG